MSAPWPSFEAVAASLAIWPNICGERMRGFGMRGGGGVLSRWTGAAKPGTRERERYVRWTVRAIATRPSSRLRVFAIIHIALRGIRRHSNNIMFLHFASSTTALSPPHPPSHHGRNSGRIAHPTTPRHIRHVRSRTAQPRPVRGAAHQQCH